MPLVETNFDVSHDEKLREAGTAFLTAAHAYWKEYQRVLKGNAVVWLEADDGSLVIFTRGEYKGTLMHNIEFVRDEVRFG